MTIFQIMTRRHIILSLCIIYLIALSNLVSAGTPVDNAQLMEQGEQFIRASNYSKAIKVFNKVKKNDPQSYLAFYKIGYCYEMMRDIDKAIKSYNQAIEINPQFADAQAGVASCYNWKNKYDDAEEYLERAIAIEPQNYRAYIEFGRMYAGQNIYTKAVDSYERAIAIDSNHAGAYFMLGQLYERQGAYDKSVESLNKAIAISPSPGYYESLGDAYVKLGYWEQAIQSFNQVLTRGGSNDRDLHYKMAKIYLFKTNQPQMAIQRLSSAIELNVNHSFPAYLNTVYYDNDLLVRCYLLRSMANINTRNMNNAHRDIELAYNTNQKWLSQVSPLADAVGKLYSCFIVPNAAKNFDFDAFFRTVENEIA